MRVILGLGIAGLLLAAACSSSTSPAQSCGSSGAAANVNATGSLNFSPNHVTITHGQSVCWENVASFTHTVTSDDGTSFNTTLPAGNRFVFVFANPGTFNYHCTIHAGMTGIVTVN
ncbi:MAG TPA: plastocyanin/azurin family copper-binding protein [Gemmatimonadales bacterium]|nr:plastocyanin/azurin family copper-binding protein [Gemmatimonadales bacterium]